MLSLSSLSQGPRFIAHSHSQLMLRKTLWNLRPLSSSLFNQGEWDVKKRNFLTIVSEYENGVTFTFGKFTSVKEPGIRMKLPFIQQMRKVDMRINLKKLCFQNVGYASGGSPASKVECVVQYKIADPRKIICNIKGAGDHIKDGDSDKYQKKIDILIEEFMESKIRENFSNLSAFRIKHNGEKIIRQQLIKEGSLHLASWGIELQAIRITHIDFG